MSASSSANSPLPIPMTAPSPEAPAAPPPSPDLTSSSWGDGPYGSPSLVGAHPEQLAGHLADNVVHFARVLRAAGLPVGTDRALLALQALQEAGIASRGDFHAVLASCLINRAEHRLLFEQAFHIFWKDPDLLGQMMRMLLPEVSEKAGTPHPENRRLAEALFAGGTPPPAPPPPAERIDIDAQLSWSDREQLRKADFDTMTTAEWNAARHMIVALAPELARIVTRRDRPSHRGSRIDLRAALRTAARSGGELAALPRRERCSRPAPIVALVDISGSVSRYSRMFLHFLHALANADLRLHAFVFGTQLTPITRPLKSRDPDVAVQSVVSAVQDWSGGTRIAECLKVFNVQWARRVLSGNPTVLLMTDGLEQGDLTLLASQIERLGKSCRELVWLNPLLRYDAFEPKARGIRTMLPHVDRLVPVHNIDSLAQLASTLAGQADPGRLPRKA